MALDVLGIVVLLVCLSLVTLTVRRHLLSRGGGVDISLRLRNGSRGRGWALGVGRYDDEQLQWYRVFSLSPRPRRSIPRAGLAVERQRRPEGQETMSLASDSVVMECRSQEGRVELAMNEAAVTGFLAWLESAPPGSARPETPRREPG